MSRTVQARLDETAERDLALLRAEGRTDSDAIRLALSEAAGARRRRSALRLEALALADDPADRAGIDAVRSDLDTIAAIWDD